VVTFLKKLLKTEAAFGGLLMQYCKQLLPPLNSFIMKKPSLGPKHAGQRVKAVGPLKAEAGALLSEIEELLELLEKTGGKVRASDSGGLPGDQVHGPHLRDRHAAVRRLINYCPSGPSSPRPAGRGAAGLLGLRRPL
jgi:hypothetical protein